MRVATRLSHLAPRLDPLGPGLGVASVLHAHRVPAPPPPPRGAPPPTCPSAPCRHFCRLSEHAAKPIAQSNRLRRYLFERILEVVSSRDVAEAAGAVRRAKSYISLLKILQNIEAACAPCGVTHTTHASADGQVRGASDGLRRRRAYRTWAQAGDASLVLQHRNDLFGDALCGPRRAKHTIWWSRRRSSRSAG